MNIPTRQLPLGAGPRIPYDAFVEYVQNSNSNYLEGTILVEDIGGIAFDVEFVADGNSIQPFGSGQRPSSWGYSSAYDRISLVSTISGGAVSSAYLDTGLGRIQMGQYTTGARIVAPRVSTSVEAYNDRKFGVFCVYNYLNGRTTLTATVRLHSLTLWDHADGLLHDFAPCRVGTAGALYDRVTGALFYSATSTALLPGPDLP